MRALFYGAGVQGSIYGAILSEAGHDVSFLARGERALQLRSDGLTLCGVLGDRNIRIARPNIVQSLEPRDDYDVCFVTVRGDQVDAILPTLAHSGVSRVVFMHNHADGSEALVRSVGAQRAVVAFPGAGGSISQDGVVRYAIIPEQSTMIGRSPGCRNAAAFVVRAFGAVGLRLSVVMDADDWLRRHAVLVGAASGALWEYGCDPQRLVKSRRGIRDFVDAVREGYIALDAARVASEPLALRAIFRWVPLPFSAAYWRRYLSGIHGETIFAAHARHAPAEMAMIAAQVTAIMRRTDVQTPTFDQLRHSIPATVCDQALRLADVQCQ